MTIKAWARKQAGFTIVELLIVIVVVGILASITIVAFSGVQSRAEYARAQAQLRTVSSKLEAFKVENDAYPISVTDCPTPAVANICLSGGDGVTLDYSPIPQGGAGYLVATQASYELTIRGTRQFVYQSPAERTGTNEFMQYADLSPIIDQYGLKPYQLSFDIKSQNTTNASTARIYFQNGSTSRYYFTNVTVPVTTEYTNHQLTFTPTLSNSSVSASMLAFYGTYSTGNILKVKNVQLRLAP